MEATEIQGSTTAGAGGQMSGGIDVLETLTIWTVYTCSGDANEIIYIWYDTTHTYVHCSKFSTPTAGALNLLIRVSARSPI